jgi:hypothetical protein
MGVAKEDDICQQESEKNMRMGDEREFKMAGQLGGVYQTRRVWTSRPAKKGGTSVRRKEER